MKTIYFIRHLKPKGSLGNHETLSFNTFCELAAGKIDPDIDYRSYPTLEKFLYRQGLKNLSYIFNSPSKRTTQTAAIMAKKYSLNQKSLVKTSYLKEVGFNPKVLITPDVWEIYGMNGLRTRVYKSILTGNGAESIHSIYGRIKNLEQLFFSLQGKEIVSVTHAFLMRFLEVYFVKGKKDFNSISFKDVSKATIYSYGEGFKTEIF